MTHSLEESEGMNIRDQMTLIIQNTTQIDRQNNFQTYRTLQTFTSILNFRASTCLALVTISFGRVYLKSDRQADYEPWNEDCSRIKFVSRIFSNVQKDSLASCTVKLSFRYRMFSSEEKKEISRRLDYFTSQPFRRNFENIHKMYYTYTCIQYSSHCMY